MTLPIEALVPSRFPTWVRRRPFAVVFVGDGVNVPRPRLVVQGLEDLFPQQLALGWMSRDSAPDARWWEQHWRTELGPFRGASAPPPGVYLFHLGWVAGHHPGVSHHVDRTAALGVRTYLIERMRLKASQGGDGTEWTRQSDGPGTGSSQPPPRMPRRTTLVGSAYELLDISPEADDTEVKKAYRTAIKLNHPDKVAHLSKEIQAFARERTQLIVAAWGEIKKERGLA
ncbi:MAG: DnaJ domain-containing protein [Alphaproteobacteria bacterium]|nr:DnaJ domain-containing protein [Alphaproteobacteria bacterium]